MTTLWKRWFGLLATLALVLAMVPAAPAAAAPDVQEAIKSAFEARAKALLHNGDVSTLDAFYSTAGNPPLIVGPSLRTYEKDKIREFHDYAAKRAMKWTDVQVILHFDDVQVAGSKARVKVTESLGFGCGDQ